MKIGPRVLFYHQSATDGNTKPWADPDVIGRLYSCQIACLNSVKKDVPASDPVSVSSYRGLSSTKQNQFYLEFLHHGKQEDEAMEAGFLPVLLKSIGHIKGLID